MFLNVKILSSDCPAMSYSTFKKSKLEISGEGGGALEILGVYYRFDFYKKDHM